MLLSGIVGLEQKVKERIALEMFELSDIMENKVLGPMIRDFQKKSVEDARQEGQREGQREALVQTLIVLLQRRFGPLPSWASEKIQASNLESLTSWTSQVLDAASIESLLLD